MAVGFGVGWGACVGVAVGRGVAVGFAVGCGVAVGRGVCSGVGRGVGWSVGCAVGAPVGSGVDVGASVGPTDGIALGWSGGTALGAALVGGDSCEALGRGVGEAGTRLGSSEGDGEIPIDPEPDGDGWPLEPGFAVGLAIAAWVGLPLARAASVPAGLVPGT
ncbi:MAG TPA: hypothetical protein VFS32_04710 [Candidatus Limnocylindrales bacterium]|nr:hypothetical protein [Candidatus Limnocylindrales bacterium]